MDQCETPQPTLDFVFLLGRGWGRGLGGGELTDLSFQPSHAQGCFDGPRDPTENREKNSQPDAPEECIDKRRLVLPG